MKEEFFGFYSPTTNEINKSWEDGIFVFDANTLLNLYRYSNSTRKDFLLVLEKLKDKLFMPHQVGLEYQTNRINVIEILSNSYDSLEKDIKEIFENQFKNQVNKFKRHPSISIDAILKLQEDFLKKIKSELEKQRKAHPDFTTEDGVLNQLTEIYKGKVGKAFSKEELQKIYSEGKARYEQQIPPGYKDLETKRKRGEQHVYGDLIIWKEVINFARKEKKLIIFVTDDRKEDWWTIENGKTIRAREELIKEFYDLTGLRILIYSADNFLQFAKQRNLVSQIKDTSIVEVKEIRKADEDYKNIIDWIKSEKNFVSQWNDVLKKYNNHMVSIPPGSGWNDIFKKYNNNVIDPTSTWNDLLRENENLREVINPSSTWRDLLKEYDNFGALTGSTTVWNEPNIGIKDSSNESNFQGEGNIDINQDNFADKEKKETSSKIRIRKSRSKKE
ncbi:MAG: PIN-like domain-containing protein [Mucilaginibacter sp.]